MYLSIGLGFSGFRGGKPKLTRRSWVVDGEDLPPTVKVVGSTSVRSDPVDFFEWVGSSNDSG